tara:strand:+ start:985 stop:2562 length:1578 start_codon:yes stop_codon:yes gene_type:complete
MQLIIPMSGLGERFLKAGYTVPKPLIKVENQEIISHVVNMFPGIKSIFFICNKNHLENPSLSLKNKLKKISPHCKIIPIDQHKKGPIHAVLKSIQFFDPYKPTIVNYCDFNCIWDFKKFKEHIKTSECDGCVVTYTGFHPHMLGSTNYAYLKLQDSNIVDIQEKKPFTPNPMEEYASSGTYFFKSAKLMEKYFKKTIEKDLNVKGEYYVSMSFKPMIEDKLKLNNFNLDYFMQWGTPEDLKEYNWYSNLFKAEAKKNNNQNKFLDNTTLLIPCAGEGKRFADKGFSDPKPLIKLSKKPLLFNALDDLPNTSKKKFIFRKDMQKLNIMTSHLKDLYPDADIQILNDKTKGQAHTCLLGLENIDLNKPLIISACDNGLVYDFSRLKGLISDETVDIIVWGCREYPGAIRSPKMFGWIEEENKLIKKIHVKDIPNDKLKDPIVTGTFYFKKSSIFKEIANQLISKKNKVNNEFYVDSCINNSIDMGYKVVFFEVDFYLCWGTPDELKTFNYWQECFSKANYHIYKEKK